MLSGGALSKMKLTNVWPTGPGIQYEMKKSSPVRCESKNSRSSYRTVKSSRLR